MTVLEELSETCPEYRLGQMVLYLAFLARENGDSMAWHIEDVEFVEAARKHLADWHAGHDRLDSATRPDQTMAKA